MALEMNRRSFVRNAALGAAAFAAVPAAFALADEAEVTTDSGMAPGPAIPEEDIVVLQIFAANSLEKALPEVQELYTEANPEIQFADSQFKGSGDLVEQLSAGAMADILITASKSTMDDAEEGDLIDPDSRIVMFNNDLVIVAAEDFDVEINELADVCDDDIESIAIGEAGSVPAGKYANQSLYSIGLYSDESGDGGEYAPEIADKINLCDKVGTCASYVSTGDCTIGFVYSSDVFRYSGIQAIFTVPEDSHSKIIYPGAVCADTEYPDEAAAFLEFCMNDPEALKIWSAYGFELAEEEEDEGDEGGEGGSGSGLVDGTYTGTGTGIGGKFNVDVTITNGVISAVEVGSNNETQGIGSNAIATLPDEMIGLSTADEVDAVANYSGASISSRAIKTAVKDCLEQAAEA